MNGVTPRTDAVVNDGWMLCGIHVVSADFARLLERELTKLEREIKNLRYELEEARRLK